MKIRWMPDRKIWIAQSVVWADKHLLDNSGARFAYDKNGTKTGHPGSWWTSNAEKALKLIEFVRDEDRPILEALASRIDSSIKLSHAVDADISIPAPEGLEYFGYQKAGVQYIAARDRWFIGDQMGLGKTVEVLGLLNLDRNIRRVLIVCPASLRVNWVRESIRWLVEKRNIYEITTKTTDEGIANVLAQDEWIVVTNYETVSKGCKFKISKPEEKYTLGTFRRLLGIMDPVDLLVCDEAHYMKSPGAQRTVAILGRDKIGARTTKGVKIPAQPRVEPLPAKRIGFLSGTPFPNRPIEIQPLAGRLHPDFANRWAFAQRYCNLQHNGYGLDMSGASNLEELQNKLRSTIMIRRNKEDALPDLPPKIRQVIYLPSDTIKNEIKSESALTKQIAHAINRHEFIIKSARNDEEYKAAIAGLHQLIKVMFTEMSKVRQRTAVAKVPLCADFIRQALDDGGIDKLVVFAHHKEVISALMKALDEYGAVALTGDMSAERRQSSVDRFMSDPKCRVFVGSIQAAGVGLTLTSSSNVVFCELDWVPGNLTQAEDRCHRYTQKNNVLVQHLVVDGTIDANMARRVVEKQAAIDRGLNRQPEDELQLLKEACEA